VKQLIFDFAALQKFINPRMIVKIEELFFAVGMDSKVINL
jgi:hypothetical protein